MDAINSYNKITTAEQASKNRDALSAFFIKRTNLHIQRVAKFMEDLTEFFPRYHDLLIERGKSHDRSKFLMPERQPYILLTWKYKCRNEGKTFKISDHNEARIREASYHHCKNNPHHAEYWDSNLKSNPINEKDRDKPSGILVDATKMDEISMLEMVSDWSAMSVEYNQKEGPKKWADDNINVRWKFNNMQRNFIYDAIGSLWG